MEKTSWLQLMQEMIQHPGQNAIRTELDKVIVPDLAGIIESYCSWNDIDEHKRVSHSWPNKIPVFYIKQKIVAVADSC